MELIGISAAGRDIPDGIIGNLHHFGSLGQTEANQEFLRRAPHAFLEELAEITPVELADIGDFLNGQVPLIVMLHKINGLLDIKILELTAVEELPGRGGPNETVQKEAQMPDQMEGCGVGIPGDIEHGIPQLVPLVRKLGAVDRL